MSDYGDFVYGVDVAIAKKLAFGFASLDNPGVEVEAIHTETDAEEGERLHILARQLRIYAGQLREEFPPACVFVEQPSGAHPNPPLSYAAGVVQAVLFDVLGCPVWTITSGDWKKRTVGVGNATKQQVGAWVRKQGPGDLFDEDLCDAYAIAYAGRQKISIQGREAA